MAFRIQLERSTKRKKNGTLLPLDSDARADAHLSRTRALLEDFETAGAVGAMGKADTTTSTPRMTLRERKKTEPWTPTATPRTTARVKSKPEPSTSIETLSIPGPSSGISAIDAIVDQLDSIHIKPAVTPAASQPQPKLRGLDKDSEEVRYSKTLAYMLRHGAEKERLPMRKDGYVRVVDMVSDRGVLLPARYDLTIFSNQTPAEPPKIEEPILAASPSPCRDECQAAICPVLWSRPIPHPTYISKERRRTFRQKRRTETRSRSE